ncbi:MAG: hypothetical protein H7336_17455 [Bacteriovorax sp.]|nr:hypothetical protein [Bacteriovorax sp.]
MMNSLGFKPIITGNEEVSESSEKQASKLRLQGEFTNSQNNNRPLAKYFYKVTNHHEFYQIGNSFLKDFREGFKSFAITSTGYKQSQQRTILALASFFDHAMPMKIAIVTNEMGEGVFKELINKSLDTDLELSMTNANQMKVKRFYHHFDFVSFDSIFKMAPAGVPNYEYEHAISQFIRNYDLVLWDTPEISAFKANNNLYYPIALYFDSLSIIVSQTLSSQSEIIELQEFFTNYGVNIKGLMLDYTTQKSIKKKSFLRFLAPWRKVEKT